MDEEIKNGKGLLYEQRLVDDGFKVPDGYFDSLEGNVLDRIAKDDIRRGFQINSQKKPAKRFALPQVFLAAAAAISLVLAAVWFFRPAVITQQTFAGVELTDEEIEAYLLENVRDFEVDQLAMLPEEPENEFQAPPATNQKVPVPSSSPEDPYEIAPEDLEDLLNDMTDEELEDIL